MVTDGAGSGPLRQGSNRVAPGQAPVRVNRACSADGVPTNSVHSNPLRSAVEVVEQSFSAAQQHRRDGDLQFVDQAGPEVLLDRRRPAGDLDVLAAGRVERPLQRGVNAVGDEVEDRAAPAW